MSSCISAIGSANPKYRTSQDDIYHFMTGAFKLDSNSAARLKLIYDNSGIKHRYSVVPDFGTGPGQEQLFFDSTPGTEHVPGTAQRMQLYQAEAVELAGEAAKKCLRSLNKDVTKTITHLITVSCTGMYAPGVDIGLIELLGLNSEVERTCINFMGCYGALNALKTADYICRAQKDAKVLVICIELCTLHFQKENNLNNWIANSLFSDGAAAALVENVSYRTGINAYLSLKTFYSEFISSAKNEMGWYIGDSGFEMRLTSKVSKFILKHIPALTEKLLKKAGLDANDIDLYAVHPGGKRILEAAETALGFNQEKNKHSHDVLRDHGNMSSASILFVFERILAEGRHSPQTILGFAFGPGITIESIILKQENA